MTKEKWVEACRALAPAMEQIEETCRKHGTESVNIIASDGYLSASHYQKDGESIFNCTSIDGGDFRCAGGHENWITKPMEACPVCGAKVLKCTLAAEWDKAEK